MSAKFLENPSTAAFNLYIYVAVTLKYIEPETSTSYHLPKLNVLGRLFTTLMATLTFDWSSSERLGGWSNTASIPSGYVSCR